MPGSNSIHERKEWSEAKLNPFREAVSALPDVNKHADLCIYVTGSYGRLEASEYSDLDLFFIKKCSSDQTEMSHIDKTLMVASLIRKCRGMQFPEFSGGGKYLKVHYLEDMKENLGGRSDDYENLFTARLLLLLESSPIYNEPLYEEVVCEIARSYFRDYQDHEEDFRPTFLVNDILRYWKTLCLNYENSRNSPDADETEAQKSHLKNLKLKFSRMLTCFSLVVPLSAPRDSIGPEECVRLMQDRPLERLRSAAIESKNEELWDILACDYSWFLEVTGKPQSVVQDWIGSSHNREEAFVRARRFGRTMYKLLVAVATPDTLRYLVI